MSEQEQALDEHRALRWEQMSRFDRLMCKHGFHHWSGPDWPLNIYWCLRCAARWPR